MNASPTVLLTDYAWPDTSIERDIIERAGYQLVAGPSEPATADVIASMVRSCNPSGILTNWAQVSAAAIAASDQLRIVARLGVGLDNIAVNACTDRGVWVTNVPDYCVEEVSDHAMAMLLAWARGLVPFDRDVKTGVWNPAAAKLRRVSTLTCGLIGFGRIGQRTAQKLQAFGVRTLLHSTTRNALDEVLAQSDVVIIHVPLTPSTHHLINANRIARMKRGAYLINVSRGAVVDTEAVIAALDSGHLCGAALDVLESEPRVPAGLARDNVILTPHVAFSSDASLSELRRRATEDVVRVLRGELPSHPVNSPRVGSSR